MTNQTCKVEDFKSFNYDGHTYTIKWGNTLDDERLEDGTKRLLGTCSYVAETFTKKPSLFILTQTLTNSYLKPSMSEIKEIMEGFGFKPLTLMKSQMISNINEYDTSDDINSFSLNEYITWFDKNNRTSLKESIENEIDLGRETTSIWVGSKMLTIKCEDALDMLKQLNVYAKDCYNVTAQHKAEVENMTVEDLLNYDWTENYPEKLVFNF